jgi:putative oxidoreductase
MKQTKWSTNDHSHIGLLILRIFIGLRLIHGVVDNIVSWTKMEEFAGFLSSFGFPFPILSAVVSVYAQFFAGIAILIGYQIRVAAALMIFNFVVALIMVHRHDSVEGMTPALAMLFGSACLFFTGAGKWKLIKNER